MFQVLILSLNLLLNFSNASEAETFSKKYVSQPNNLQSIELFVKPGESPIAVQFGNKDFGYFETKDFSLVKNKIILKLIPPTFQKPIEFFIVSGDKALKKRFASKIQFKNNLLLSNLRNFKSSGQVTFNYFIVNHNTYESATKYVNADPIIVNKFGEILWVKPYIPILNKQGFPVRPRGSQFFNRFKDKYVFLSKYKATRLEQYDLHGQLEFELDFKSENLPMNSHGFDFDPVTKELFYLTFDCRDLSRKDEFVPLFKGLKGLYYLATLPRRSYSGNKLVSLNLETKKLSPIWSVFDSFSPGDYPSLFLGSPENRPDRFYDVLNKEKYLALIDNPIEFADWSRNCHVDWTHANSIKYYPNVGYLVSIRNINKIVLIGLDGHLKWSLGEDATDTYRINDAEQMFSMQHSASFIDNFSKILLFDNNIPYRGNVKKDNKLRNMLKVIYLPKKPGNVEVVENYIIPSAQSTLRGYAKLLENDTFFTYVPGNQGTKENIIQLNRKGELLGHLSWTAPGGRRGVEAIPLEAIGSESFVKNSNSALGQGKDVQPIQLNNYNCESNGSCSEEWHKFIY